jgi:nucleotide-binding universal stress UspA family protein
MLPIKRILCPTDFSGPSYEALKYGIELASHFGAEICLVYVMQEVPRPTWALQLYSDPEVYEMEIAEYEEALHVNAQRKVNEVIEQRLPKDTSSRAIVVQGETAAEIARVAEEEHVDLIVIATHGMTGWRHLVFGSVTEKVLRLAGCPVLTVRQPREKK